MSSNEGAAGFFGKVISHGDFVANRFDRGLRQFIDGWLQRSIEYSRRSLGQAWPRNFETMPVWRFMLTPGLVGRSGFAGLMMPSADRVGRHFPLLVAARLALPPPKLHVTQNMHMWFDEAERLLLSARRSGFDLDRFDEALAALPMPVNEDGEIVKGRSFWWTGGAGASRRFSASGLPAPESFERLLGEAAPPNAASIPPRSVEQHRPFILHAVGASHCGTRLQIDATAMTDGRRDDLHALAQGQSHGMASAQAAALVIDRLLRIAPASTIADLVARAKGELGSINALLRNSSQALGAANEVSVVVLMAVQARLAVIWTGDLRCYLLRDGLVRCLTHDHIEVGLHWRRARAVGSSTLFACDIVTDELLMGDRFLLVGAHLVELLGERAIAAHLAEPRLTNIPIAVIKDALLHGVGGNVAAVAIAAAPGAQREVP